MKKNLGERMLDSKTTGYVLLTLSGLAGAVVIFAAVIS